MIAHTCQINCWPLPTFNFYISPIGNFIEFLLEYSVDQREEGKFNFVSFSTLFAYQLLQIFVTLSHYTKNSVQVRDSTDCSRILLVLKILMMV